MTSHHINIALRNLLRGRVYSAINLGGLAIGFAIVLAIALYVQHEYSHDRFHVHADRIVLFQQFEGSAAGGGAWRALLEAQLPEVAAAARLSPHQALLSVGGQSFYETNFFFADSSAFDVFTFPLLQGSAATVFSEPHSVVLTEAMAQKYFGHQNPIGQTIRFEQKQDLLVTGVMRNLPSNSHLSIDFLCNHARAEELTGSYFQGYWDGSHYTYLLLAPGHTAAQLSPKVADIAAATNDPNRAIWTPSLIPLRDIYLHRVLSGQVKSENAAQRAAVFAWIAAVVLLMACFNYINLTTARATRRAKEVGVKKTMGATRSQLAAQFLWESAFFVAAAFALSLALLGLLLPWLNQVTLKSLSFSELLTPLNAQAMGGLLLLITLLAGLYPAWLLSGMRPAHMLKGNLLGSSSPALFRKTLVVVQFAASILMIVCTIVVSSQLHYIRHKNVGYDRAQVLTLTFQGEFEAASQQRFKQDVAALPFVSAASYTSHLPGGSAVGYNKLAPNYLPAGTDVNTQFMFADEDYLRTLDIKISEGRPFLPTTEGGAVELYINETAQRRFGWASAAGRPLAYTTYQYSPSGSYAEVPVVGTVVGVLKDYHTVSLRSAVEPLLIVRWPEPLSSLAVKIEGGNIPQAISAIGQHWSAAFPGVPFAYTFLDDTFQATYAADARAGQVLGVFAVFAIFISCLGLLGLAIFTVEQRSKEIGVRKVLGASATSLVGLVSKDFLVLVLIAFVIATPLAYWSAEQWLQDFAYRIHISWWVFALAGAAAVLVAFLTVSLQSIATVLANPVQSLRTE